jgi:hypothetical protein
MRFTTMVLLAAALLGAGCRQPEGTIPQPAGEQANKTDDISRDLLAVARQDEQGLADLQSDLANLTGDETPRHLLENLVMRLNDALAGTQLTEETARTLARHLFVTISVRELSERQVETLRKEVASTLAAAGVPPPKAEPVAAAVAEIQQAVTTNRRRWWQRA